MQITVYKNFSKRNNSTKRPTGGTDLDVKLIRDINLMNPTFLMQGVDYSINYIKWNDRYYFVSDVVATNNGQSEISCVEDVLASWKNNILASKQYVKYSSNQHLVFARDDRYNPPNNVSITTHQLQGDGLFNVGGTYILSVLTNSANGTHGAATAFALTVGQMATLANTLMSESFWERFQIERIKPLDFLVSCLWVPIPASAMTGETVSSILIGWESIAVSALKLTSTEIGRTWTINDIFGSEENSYLMNSPFTTAAIFLPFVGTVDLDIDNLCPSYNVVVKLNVDLLTGDIIYRVGSSEDTLQMKLFSGNCASSAPIVASTNDVMAQSAGIVTTLGGTVATLAGIATSNAPLALKGAASLAGGVMATIKGSELHTQVNGSISSQIGIFNGLRAVIILLRKGQSTIALSDDWKAKLGLPLNSVVALSGLSGYCQTEGASVPMAGLEAEKTQVNTMLDSGIYIE